MTDMYIIPISKKFPKKYDWLFEEIPMVSGYAEAAYDGLLGCANSQKKPFVSDIRDDEAYRNANIGLYLKDVLINNMQL